MHKTEKWDGLPQKPHQSGPHELKSFDGISFWGWWSASNKSTMWTFFLERILAYLLSLITRRPHYLHTLDLPSFYIKEVNYHDFNRQR